jgi:ATP-dependent Lon protease
MLNNSKYKNKFIGLVGPPGVGKTAISSIIAKSLNLPFKHISLGGIKDASVLIGHSSTYVGSKPGLLVNTLNEMKYLNGVILLDEIDKVGSDFNDKKSISSVLIHLLDKSQNKSFQDSFMPEVPIDMSNVLFIVSMNDVNKIDKILKDRLNSETP